jgi:hypothetical protein
LKREHALHFYNFKAPIFPDGVNSKRDAGNSEHKHKLAVQQSVNVSCRMKGQKAAREMWHDHVFVSHQEEIRELSVDFSQLLDQMVVDQH